MPRPHLWNSRVRLAAGRCRAKRPQPLFPGWGRFFGPLTRFKNRPLLGNRFRVSELYWPALGYSNAGVGPLRKARFIYSGKVIWCRPHILRRHQPSVVAKRLKSTTEMMRPDAGLHANQTGRHIGKP